MNKQRAKRLFRFAFFFITPQISHPAKHIQTSKLTQILSGKISKKSIEKKKEKCRKKAKKSSKKCLKMKDIDCFDLFCESIYFSLNYCNNASSSLFILNNDFLNKGND